MKEKIADRITKNFSDGMRYFDLEQKVFPGDDYPRAWNYSCNGGPPACRRVLMSALKRYGYIVKGTFVGDRRVYLK